MKIYNYEPSRLNDNGINVSSRYSKIMDSLSSYNPIELTLTLIASHEPTFFDNEDNLIIAHYTDVYKFFDNLESFKKAIVIFHTDSWNPKAYNTDENILKISNKKNRFCIHSEPVKEYIKTYVDELIDSSDPVEAFNILLNFDKDLERLLKPFSNWLPTLSIDDESVDKESIILAKNDLDNYIQEKQDA